MSIYNHYTIYKITNLINNKVYIGQTTQNLSDRWKQHRKSSKTSNFYLYYSMRKYGIENFTIEPICSCFDLIELNKMESFFISEFKSTQNSVGYNCTAGGDNAISGKSNPNYDNKIYHWYHKSGIEEIMTQHELRKKYNLGFVGNVLTGKNFQHKGWSIKPHNLKPKMKTPNVKLTKQFIQYSSIKHHWFNFKTNRDIVCTSLELENKFNIKRKNLYRIFTERAKTCNGWCLYSNKEKIINNKNITKTK